MFLPRLFTCKATRTQPGILLLKDYTMYLTCEKNMHGDNFTFGPGEIFGFNVGTTSIKQVTDLQSFLVFSILQLWMYSQGGWSKQNTIYKNY